MGTVYAQVFESGAVIGTSSAIISNMRLETRGVLGGAYKNQNAKSLLTHAVEVDDSGNAVAVLCKRVQLDSIVDPFAHTPAELVSEPTCKQCAARWRLRTNLERA